MNFLLINIKIMKTICELRREEKPVKNYKSTIDVHSKIIFSFMCYLLNFI